MEFSAKQIAQLLNGHVEGDENITVNNVSKIEEGKEKTLSFLANPIYTNFIYTTNHYGSFPINSLQTIDLHCVNTASINTASTASISNTKIGTIRVKSIAYESASNTSNGSTYVYKAFVFDANVGSITGTVNSATSTTLTLANSVAGNVFSTIDDATQVIKVPPQPNFLLIYDCLLISFKNLFIK